MNYRMIVRLLSITLRIVALLMIPSLLVSALCCEGAAVFGFAVTIALMLLLSLPTQIWKPRKTTLYAREGFVITALTWITLSILGALPFLLSDPLGNTYCSLICFASAF